MIKIFNIKRKGMYMSIVAVVTIGILVSSCVRRDLAKAPGYVELSFDWSRLTAYQSLPNNMEIFFYGEDGSVGTLLSNNSQTKFILPAGKYKIMAHKHNLVPGINCSALESYNDAYAYALPMENKAELSGIEWIQEPAKWFYSGVIDEITITEGDTSKQIIKPRSLVNRINLNIDFTGESSNVTNVNASLAGLAPEVFLASESLEGSSSNIIFTSKKYEGASFSASLLTFGVIKTNDDGSESSNVVSFEIGFSNGGSQPLSVDISEGLSGGNIDVDVQIEATVEVSSTSDLGYTAEVTKWVVTNGDVVVDNADQIK